MMGAHSKNSKESLKEKGGDSDSDNDSLICYKDVKWTGVNRNMFQ